MTWNRVSRSRLCPVCGKADWCLRANDDSAALCMRIESDRPGKFGGWIHRLVEDGWKPTRWRPVRKTSRNADVVPPDCESIAKRLCGDVTDRQLRWLSRNLGVSVDALMAFRVGADSQRQVFSFPMVNASGRIVGLRYRACNGKKFSEKGGREGMFVPTGELGRRWLIVEGPTDAAAIWDLGFRSVIGRSNCQGNVAQLKTLARRKRPSSVLIIPDADKPGINGARQLSVSLSLIVPCRIETMRAEFGKDVREAKRKNAESLADWLGALYGNIIHRKEVDQ